LFLDKDIIILVGLIKGMICTCIWIFV